MKYEKFTVEELHALAKKYINEINDMKKCLELIPEDSLLATLSLNGYIKLKTKKLNEVLDAINRRERIDNLGEKNAAIRDTSKK